MANCQTYLQKSQMIELEGEIDVKNNMTYFKFKKRKDAGDKNNEKDESEVLSR